MMLTMTTTTTSPGLLDAATPVSGDAGLPDSADDDLKGSLIAIRRAALAARQLAARTGTDLIVLRAGQVVRVSPVPEPAR